MQSEATTCFALCRLDAAILLSAQGVNCVFKRRQHLGGTLDPVLPAGWAIFETGNMHAGRK